MSLKGDIKDFNISEIIQFLGLQTKTGVLTVKSKDKTVRLYFVDGRIVRADPDRSEHKMLMGEMLIAYGKLTREQLQFALEVQKKTRRFLGEILLGLKLVSKKDVQQVVQRQIYETVYNLFRWKQGTFEFEVTDIPKNLKILPALGLDQLLLNVSWMTDEWHEIEKFVPSMGMIFEKVHGEKEGNTGKGQVSRIRDGLTPGQKIVYDLVNGKRTVKEIIDLSMLGHFETCRILSVFLNKGYIRAVREDRSLGNRPKGKRIGNSKVFSRVLSLFLILILVYCGVKYVTQLITFNTRYAPYIVHIKKVQVRNVVIPTLYQQYLTYRLIDPGVPFSVKGLRDDGIILQKELKVLSSLPVKAYVRLWERSYPF